MVSRYATPTKDLVERFESEPNPVTKSVLRDIIARRIGLKRWSTVEDEWEAK